MIGPLHYIGTLT